MQTSIARHNYMPNFELRLGKILSATVKTLLPYETEQFRSNSFISANTKSSFTKPGNPVSNRQTQLTWQ
jgi:hypothetical protein